MSKTVLVTGGAGFIGSHLVEKLVSRGDRVVVLDDFNDYYDPKLKWQNLRELLTAKAIEVVEADIRTEGMFEAVFKTHAVDTVVHLAARAGVRPSLEQPELYWDVNVMGSLHLLEAMKAARVPQLVFASSSSVYGERGQGPFGEGDNTDRQISPYGASKKALEVMAHAYSKLYGIKATGLRFFTAYGPRNRPDMACFKFVDALMRGQPIQQYGDGSSGRDYTYIEDIVSGVVSAIDRPFGFEVINLGNETPIRLSEMIGVVERATGKKAIIREVDRQPGDVSLTFADTKKARELLGWEANTAFETGMKKLVEWYAGRA